MGKDVKGEGEAGVKSEERRERERERALVCACLPRGSPRVVPYAQALSNAHGRGAPPSGIPMPEPTSTREKRRAEFCWLCVACAFADFSSWEMFVHADARYARHARAYGWQKRRAEMNRRDATLSTKRPLLYQSASLLKLPSPSLLSQAQNVHMPPRHMSPPRHVPPPLPFHDTSTSTKRILSHGLRLPSTRV